MLSVLYVLLNPRKTPMKLQVFEYFMKGIRACEVAQSVKTLVAKPEDPSSIPGNHMVKEENQLLYFDLLIHP